MPIAWYFTREVEVSDLCRLQFSWFSPLDSSPSSSSCSFHELLSLHLGQRALKCCCSSSLQGSFIYRSSSVSYRQSQTRVQSGGCRNVAGQVTLSGPQQLLVPVRPFRISGCSIWALSARWPTLEVTNYLWVYC